MRTHLRTTVPVLALTGALVACGTSSSSSGSGSVTGTVGSTSFSAASTLAFRMAANTDSHCTLAVDGGQPNCTTTSTGQAVVIGLTNRPETTCATLVAEESAHANQEFANMDTLVILVANETGDVATGTYAVVNMEVDASVKATTAAGGMFLTTTSTCKSGLQVESTAGSVTLTQVSASSVQGTYSITFGSQGSFSGSFDVALCNLPDASLFVTVGDAGTPTCTP